MELYQLQYFLEVCRTRNFTRAAERLNLAQPALSEQIRRLETELGARLFDRGRRESVPTAAGMVLEERAKLLLEQAESAARAVSDLEGLRAGRVVVGAIPSVSACLLPGVVGRFRSEYPLVELVLVEGTSVEVAEGVESGRNDLGLVQLPVPMEALRSEAVLEEDFLVLVSTGHRFASRKSVAIEDLGGEPFVFYKGRARDSALEACRAAGFSPRVACETGELDTLRSLVGAGLGVALIPRLAAERGAQGCVSLRVSGEAPRRKLALVWHRKRTQSPASQVFREMLRELVGGARRRR